MKKLLLKILATLTGRRKSVQNRREKSFLKSLEVFNGDTSKKFISLRFIVQTPKEFVKAVNEQMKSVYHFKAFKLKNVEAFNIYSSENDKFLHTVYALKKPYGVFYIVVGTSEILFEFNEELNWNAKKAETFRIYEPSQNSKSYYDTFYLCKLQNGIVKVQGVFKEWLNSDGRFITEAHEGYVIKFPIRYDKL